VSSGEDGRERSVKRERGKRGPRRHGEKDDSRFEKEERGGGKKVGRTLRRREGGKGTDSFSRKKGERETEYIVPFLKIAGGGRSDREEEALPRKKVSRTFRGRKGEKFAATPPFRKRRASDGERGWGSSSPQGKNLLALGKGEEKNSGIPLRRRW